VELKLSNNSTSAAGITPRKRPAAPNLNNKMKIKVTIELTTFQAKVLAELLLDSRPNGFHQESLRKEILEELS